MSLLILQEGETKMDKEHSERDSSVDVEEAKAILQKSVSKGISE